MRSLLIKFAKQIVAEALLHARVAAKPHVDYEVIFPRWGRGHKEVTFYAIHPPAYVNTKYFYCEASRCNFASNLWPFPLDYSVL